LASSSPPSSPLSSSSTDTDDDSSEERELRSTIERCNALESMINSRDVCRPEIRDSLHAFLYSEYATVRQQTRDKFEWVVRNYARRLASHAQELRRDKRFSEAKRLVSLCVDICEKLTDTKPGGESPQRVFQAVGVTWAAALVTAGMIELQAHNDRQKADEHFLMAQKLYLRLPDQHPYKAFNLACIYSICEQPQDCYKWLDECYQQGNLTLQWFADETDFENVRNCKWFSELLAKVAERDRERVQRELAARQASERCSVQ